MIQQPTAQQQFMDKLFKTIGDKLDEACRIVGISQEDLDKGIKHINVVNKPGQTTYIYAEGKLTLLVVKFQDDIIKVRRIKRREYLMYKALNVLHLN